MNYGNAIRVARSAKGMSQKDLASKTALDPNYLCMLEKNKRAPSVGTLEAIAKSLDIPIHLLLLLASEKTDLRSIAPTEAEALGRYLLEMITNAPSNRGAIS